MKKLLPLILFSMVCSMASAQKVYGSFRSLNEQVRVKMTIDFSQAYIHGMTEEEFTEYEKDYEKDKPQLIALIYDYASKYLAKRNYERSFTSVGNYKDDTDPILVLTIRSISATGDYDCDISLFKKDDDKKIEIGRAVGIRASGGRFGSKLNLMKDGAEHLGEELGKFLYRAPNSRNPIP